MLRAMTMSPTMPSGDLPWQKGRRRGGRGELHLVIAWSLDEPERIGESAAIGPASVLGRGGAQKDDPAPRLVFHQRRPRGAEPMAPLAATRVSRLQLHFVSSADATTVVTSIGKCSMLVNGEPRDEAELVPGDVIVLRNALVLYVDERAAHEPLVAYPNPEFAFGAADRHGIVGESSAIWRLRDQLALAAQSPHHVLVRGPSGAGKELAARAIHGLSPVAARALVARNASTFPEGLVDAELFGTAKNYPNVGSPERVGVIGEDDGSTLLLDEIAELPQTLQAHLLRVLDSGGEYQRLGEARPRQAKLRVVAATNAELTALKHDLAARFSSRIEVPPLGDRRDDVPLLIRHVLAKLARESADLRARFFEGTGDSPIPRIDPMLVDALLRHDYTHHLRELERLLWRAASTSQGDFIGLTPEVAKALTKVTRTEEAPEPSLEEIEAALAETENNVTHAARKLGLSSRYALYRLIKKHR
ncbi:hypothetical protein BH09MYX1_BH09MYX1_03620 [soil metagenome]